MKGDADQGLAEARADYAARRDWVAACNGYAAARAGAELPPDDLAFRSSTSTTPSEPKGMWNVGAGASTPLAAWIPPLETAERHLRRGARVAEVGFAATSAIIELAIAYPASTFHGFDDDEAVEAIRLAVARAGSAIV